MSKESSSRKSPPRGRLAPKVVLNHSPKEAPGFLRMTADKTTFLVDRLGQDCSPGQFLRELTQNAIEAVHRTGKPGQVLWHGVPSPDACSGKATIKLAITDTGEGMTVAEMKDHLNHLASSGSRHAMDGNFGVGAKISTLPHNPAGVLYLSWKDNQGNVIRLQRNPPSGEYGLVSPTNGSGRLLSADDLRPGLIDSHGTQVILLGAHEKDDTTQPPDGLVQSPTWIAKYLNARYFRFPADVAVQVHESHNCKLKSGLLRTLTGQGPYLEDHAITSGVVKLRGGRAHWWILENDRSSTADAAFIESAGHTAALFRDELYELRSSRVGVSRLQQFGVIFGHRQVVIYVEPLDDRERTIGCNTARTHLLVANQPLPWEEWAAEFRKSMPPQLRKFVREQGNLAEGASHDSTIRKRLSRIFDLYRVYHYRSHPSGNESAGEGNSTTGVNGVLNLSKSHGAVGDSRSGKKQRTAKRLGQPEIGSGKIKVRHKPYPQVAWLSTRDGTRTVGFLDDRAAAYLIDQNVLQINADFWVFSDMIEHCRSRVTAIPGVEDMVASLVRGWYEQALIETVIGVSALCRRKEWSSEEVQKAISAEALTAAVMQRYHIAHAVSRDLRRNVPGATSKKSRR